MYQLIIIDDEEKIAEGMSELFPWANVGFEIAGILDVEVGELLRVSKPEKVVE